MIHSQRIVVLYDSITNSVFISQVLVPLQAWLAVDPARTALLISFEATDTTHHPARAHIALEKRIQLIIYKRTPFFGIPSLWYSIFRLKKIFLQNQHAQVIARGPFASFACMRARANNQKPVLKLQVRGLLSHEYAYTIARIHSPAFFPFKQWWFHYKLWLYTKLETALYMQKDVPSCIFEVVSPALQEYLVTTYGMNPKNLSIACDDIPQPLSMQKRKQWRTKMRTTLNIPDNAFVYCYNGSAKPWQLPPIFFTFCQDKIAPYENIHLLVISQDHELCKQLLQSTKIPADRCHLVCAEQHNTIYQYLAAADAGLAFRDATLLNWVARPTKLLEYQAVGLRIIHNGTIAWLAESARNQQLYHSPANPPVSDVVLPTADRHSQNL